MSEKARQAEDAARDTWRRTKASSSVVHGAEADDE